MFSPAEWEYVEAGRVGRLATADAGGRPNVVPICYAFSKAAVVSPIDEKPQTVDSSQLRRIRDIETNPRVALVVDQYSPDWSSLGWVQIRGRATVRDPGATTHESDVTALQSKYDQYDTHALDDRPIIRITPGSVRSWGELDAG